MKTLICLGLAFLAIGDAHAQSSFAGNAQHTAIYSTAAQNLNAVHWTTSIDLNNPGDNPSTPYRDRRSITSTAACGRF